MIVDGDEKRPLLLYIALGLVNNVSYASPDWSSLLWELKIEEWEGWLGSTPDAAL